ncbi:hypothetical protein HMPREF9374_3928 [Desmospora sp. 8437]|nr:hypothetical protein HMPREF9374_3928 [Desmospora sp. 8437]
MKRDETKPGRFVFFVQSGIFRRTSEIGGIGWCTFSRGSLLL